MTAEEFFRNKIKEKNPITEVVTLSTYLVTAEEAMLWAYEFNKLEKSEKPINLEGNKTAVQWLIEQILVKENTSYFNMRTNDIDLSYYVNKALEMDRYQIIDAYYQCGKDNFEHIKVINRSATEYFTDTYQTEP